MLLFTNSDPIAVKNHINANYTWRNSPELVFGVSNVKLRTGHFLVFDSHLVKDALPIDFTHADANGVVDWECVDKYMRSNATAVPNFRIRSERISNAISAAKDDTEHTLSALASHIRHDLRPLAMQEIVKFLTDKRATNFSLSKKLAPQRGKTKQLYDRACAANFAALKAAITSGNSDHFEATYWRVMIGRHNGTKKAA